MRRVVLAILLSGFAASVHGGDVPDGPWVYGHERGPHLVGAVERQDIEEQFPDWNAGYADYEPAPGALETLATVDQPVEIVCVLGTWCHDSEREVPRFWKVLDAADNDLITLEMYAVGRADDEGARAVEEELGFAEPLREVWQVELVPTFVFLRDGEEIGRITETPETTLEEDTATLLAAAPAAPVWR